MASDFGFAELKTEGRLDREARCIKQCCIGIDDVLGVAADEVDAALPALLDRQPAVRLESADLRGENPIRSADSWPDRVNLARTVSPMSLLLRRNMDMWCLSERPFCWSGLRQGNGLTAMDERRRELDWVSKLVW